VGGIGSGKSTVAGLLSELGALVIDSDRTNHALLDTPEVQRILTSWWGDKVVDAEGRTDRGALRRIVAENAESRQRLEALMHPRIAQARESVMTRHADDPGVKAFVWDTPLLYEAGLADQCDVVIFVEADREVRFERVALRRGWGAEDLDRFEKAQWPLDFKRKRADHTVENNSEIGVLRPQVEDVFSRILSGESIQRR
jgi:dephospho-CoA kinase